MCIAREMGRTCVCVCVQSRDDGEQCENAVTQIRGSVAGYMCNAILFSGVY